MFGMTDISTAYSGIKAAIELAKGISNLKTETEINQAVIEIQRTLLDAQSAAFDDKANISILREKVNALEIQIAARLEWQTDRSRYVLTESLGGAFTFDLRLDAANGEVFHRLCVKCFEENRKSILHIKAKHNGGEIVHCPHCQSDLTLSQFRHPSSVALSERQRGW